MKNKLYRFLITALASLTVVSCHKAKKDIDILINADVIHYSVILEVNDGTGKIPENLGISAIGDDANVIYDITGEKELALNNGLITLGVHPKHEPETDKPVNFSVKLSGPGYVSQIVPLTIAKGQFNQVKKIHMLKLSTLPESVTMATETAPLAANGTSAGPIIVSSPTNAETQEVTTVTVPTNTQFLNASGNTITGTSVDLQVINYNTQVKESTEYFPGGQLNAAGVIDPDNKTISAFFVPAGLASVSLKVNNVEVKQFNQPITISIELDPTLKLLSTNAPAKAGDQLAIWSYSEDTQKWKYEKQGTVSMIGGKPVVQFTTNHLTYYSVAEYVETTACNSLSLVFNASWLNTDTQPLILEIWNNDETKLLSSQTIIVHNGLEYLLNNLPSFNVKYKILTTSGEQLASGTIADPCSGGKVNVTVSAPAAPVTGITLTLIVKCPDKGIVTPPDFYLYYKTPGAADTEYQLLGVVKQGKLATTLLKIGKSYDFKAQWGSHQKVIKNYLINKDNLSTTVGLNDHIGDVSPDKNRAILIEECSKI